MKTSLYRQLLVLSALLLSAAVHSVDAFSFEPLSLGNVPSAKDAKKKGEEESGLFGGGDGDNGGNGLIDPMNALQVAGQAVLGGAIFAGGVLLSNRTNTTEPDPVPPEGTRKRSLIRGARNNK